MMFASLAFAVTLLGADAPPSPPPAPAPSPSATPDPADAARYFLGAWSCGGVTWRFDLLEPGSPWIRVNYHNDKTSFGTAVMGYVPRLGVYVYRDFHADGAYADLTSAPPDAGKWRWEGPFYQIDGSAPLHGRITYVIVSSTHYDRIFESVTDGAFKREGGDTCTKQP